MSPDSDKLVESCFLSKLAAAWPVESWREVPIVIAVSGGADSVALLRGLIALCEGHAARLVVAHFNHALRDTSDDDERFVAELCQHLRPPPACRVALELGRAGSSIQTQAAGEGLESAARTARYEFLKTTATNHGARFVVTAHTADDQAETIMHRILRGTGVAGVAGIPRLRQLSSTVTLIRPLLGLRRREIEDYLRALDQPFRVDPTNLDTSFTRNRIRHELLPLLAENYNSRIVEALLRLGDLCGQAQEVVDLQVEVLSREAVTWEANESVRLDCGRLAGVAPYLIRELSISIWKKKSWPLQDMSHDKWMDLARRVESAERDEHQHAAVLPGRICVSQGEGFIRFHREMD